MLETLRDHVARTSSDRAAALLADESELFERLSAIAPRAFLTITALREAAAARGEDPDANAVWNEIMEATHG